jgi:choline dehydrogenase
VRWTAAKAFLHPVRQRPNLTVWTGAQVRKLLFDQLPDGRLRCAGVELQPAAGRPAIVRAARGVVMAAGAVATPQILLRSGIGARALLQQQGITSLLDLPGVGENLQDHLQIRAVFGVSGTRTLNTIAASWWGKAQIGLEYLLRRTGPMSMAPSQLGAFARSSPDRRWANVEYHVQPLSLPAFGEPLDRFDAFTASVCNLNPTSRGHVRLDPSNPDGAPRITLNYLSTEEDRRVAAESIRLTRHIVAQPALARYRPQELKPGLEHQSDEDLARLAGDIGTTIFHPVGTCRMGRTDDPMAVVDPRLALRGAQGLHIADASVMPTITSGNTNSPTLMIAERAAGWILQSD